MIRYSITTVALLLASFVMQQMLPAFTGLHGSRILIVQLVFLCCAVSVHQPVVLLLAFIGGFLWDAQCTLGPHVGDPEIYNHPVESLQFGYSILLFGGMGMLMMGVQPLFHEGRWYLASAITGLAIFLYLAAEYALICFVRGDLVLTRDTLLEVVFTSLFTMLFAPLMFRLLHSIAEFFNHSIQPHGNRRRKAR